MSLLEIMVLVAWGFIFFFYGYNNIFIASKSFHITKPFLYHKPNKKIACITAAYNEELVIADLIEDLKLQKYPSNLYKIFVIADNCTDKTEQIAKNKGALVFSRKNESERGKGYAIRYALEKIFNDYENEKWDAICVFDADNRVSLNFLQKMNDGLCEGYEFMQGYLGTKNPRDNWITKSIWLNYIVSNRMWQNAKQQHGLSVACGGTGFCISSRLIGINGWNAFTLTEDLEVQIQLALKGVKCRWVHDAEVFDEKPRTLKIALDQRVRWLKGHMECFKLYSVKLVKSAFREHRMWLLDQFVYLFSCFYYGLVGFITFMYLLFLSVGLQSFILPDILTVFINVLIVAYLFIGILLETKSLKLTMEGLVYNVIFSWVWVAAFFLAIVTWRNKKWVHTPHGFKQIKGEVVS